MGARKKKVEKPVELKPFHEVAIEALEGDIDSPHYRAFQDLVQFGEDAYAAPAYFLSVCIVPEHARDRCVAALIAAVKRAEEEGTHRACARALTRFNAAEEVKRAYLETDMDSDLKKVLTEMGEQIPERPKKKPAKSAAKKSGSAGNGGGVGSDA